MLDQRTAHGTEIETEAERVVSRQSLSDALPNARSDDLRVNLSEGLSENVGAPTKRWKPTIQLLPMENMPGAMNIDEIPFGMESVIPGIRCHAQPCERIPPSLDSLAPGPVLAALLSAIDVTKISATDQVVVMRSQQRILSHWQANLHRTMAILTSSMTRESAANDRDAEEGAEAEISIALRLSRRAARRQLDFALTLTNRLPRLSDMLARGDIDLPRAMAIDTSTAHLSDIEAQAILDQVAELATELTVGQLRARIARLCISIDPKQAKKRYDHASDRRMIFATLNPSGTANLMGFDLPPDKVARITDRIDAIARTMRVSGETRNIDQLRADIFLDLLAGRNHLTARRGNVDVRVDLSTLLMLTDNPGKLAGFGPVIADVARRVVGEAHKSSIHINLTSGPTRTATDTKLADMPSAEAIVSDMKTPARRPTGSQRRRIEVRDPACVFPACRVPSTRSDIDHMVAVQSGGETSDTNLAPLCRYHHRIKHEHSWSYERMPDGRYRWASRIGQVVFTTSSDPP